ncbi:hypothetical protein O6H91_12G065300 [Diphasiastrum complanatum]|uniref:Uncharacterized protein n=1 Tax=Diphasiastrum complanatum TaxID=34168 RepID=A0ACC2C2Q3_DIPCM|nr:hypothetical protein O6H91_12G065300 [Diphasiastrum complanatum]
MLGSAVHRPQGIRSRLVLDLPNYRSANLWRAIMQCLPLEVSGDEYAESFQSRLQVRNVAGKGDDLHDSPEWRIQQLPLSDQDKNTLVLDLDETLVHSSFKLIPKYDFTVDVEIDNVAHTVYVLKRPGVHEFLEAMGKIFELVVFTASLRKYACPLLDNLDLKSAIKHRLYRESCRQHAGGLVKDLSVLGRNLPRVIIIDNNPQSYALQPENAIPISSFIDDPKDRELTNLIPFLNSLSKVNNVIEALHRPCKRFSNG